MNVGQGLEQEKEVWSEDMGVPPPELLADALIDAANISSAVEIRASSEEEQPRPASLHTSLHVWSSRPANQCLLIVAHNCHPWELSALFSVHVVESWHLPLEGSYSKDTHAESLEHNSAHF